jgi:hypothetical protein
MMPEQKNERKIKPILGDIPAILNYTINFCFNVEALSARLRQLLVQHRFGRRRIYGGY